MLWRSVLLVEEKGVPGRQEKTANLSQVTVKLNYIMLYRVHLAMNAVRNPNYSGIDTDCTEGPIIFTFLPHGDDIKINV